jgi:hypothetical protein
VFRDEHCESVAIHKDEFGKVQCDMADFLLIEFGQQRLKTTSRREIKFPDEHYEGMDVRFADVDSEQLSSCNQE